MKTLALHLLAVFVLAASIGISAQNPVVVELFTSEGCSSCPPADAVLLQLSQKNNPALILLGEHVDYWNYIGWTDHFSSKQFSERQNDYAKALHASVYTPQMVIDGRDQFVGNNTAEVQKRIAEAAKTPMSATVSLAWERSGKLRVGVQSPQSTKGVVLLAITEGGLSTEVGKGENGGKTLHHAAVVRSLRPIGDVAGGKFENTVDVSRQGDWNSQRLKVAVLVQEPSSMKIVGAAELSFAQQRYLVVTSPIHKLAGWDETKLTSGAGARVVFDPVGGQSFTPLTESMARGGILLVYGALSTEPTQFPLFTVLGKSLTLKGYLNGEVTNNDAALERAKAFITKGLTSSLLKPVIARTFPLEEIQEATRFLASNAQIGKVVVHV